MSTSAWPPPGTVHTHHWLTPTDTVATQRGHTNVLTSPRGDTTPKGCRGQARRRRGTQPQGLAPTPNAHPMACAQPTPYVAHHPHPLCRVLPALVPSAGARPPQ